MTLPPARLTSISAPNSLTREGEIPTGHVPLDPAAVDGVFKWLEVELEQLERRFESFWTVKSIMRSIRP
jgi:hypothetical protein